MNTQTQACGAGDITVAHSWPAVTQLKAIIAAQLLSAELPLLRGPPGWPVSSISLSHTTQSPGADHHSTAFHQEATPLTIPTYSSTSSKSCRYLWAGQAGKADFVLEPEQLLSGWSEGKQFFHAHPHQQHCSQDLLTTNTALLAQ